MSPIDLATSRASLLILGVVRLRNCLSPSSSSASRPRNMYPGRGASSGGTPLRYAAARRSGSPDSSLAESRRRSNCPVISSPSSALMKATSSTMNTPGSPDPGHVLNRRLRRQPAVAAAVEGPGAAEGAVPGTAAGELDGRGRVHHPDEVFAPPPAQMPGRRWSSRLCTIAAGGPARPGVTAPGTSDMARSGSAASSAGAPHLALALEHDVDGAVGVRRGPARPRTTRCDRRRTPVQPGSRTLTRLARLTTPGRWPGS